MGGLFDTFKNMNANTTLTQVNKDTNRIVVKLIINVTRRIRLSYDLEMDLILHILSIYNH